MASFLFEHHKILCLGLFDNPDSLRNCSNIYNYSCIYKEAHGLDKYKRKIAEHSGGMCCMQRWYGEWTKRIKDADTIMISDGIRGRDIIEYIHKKIPKLELLYIT